MQSVVVYGRLVARAIFAGMNNEFQQIHFKNGGSGNSRPLRLVTASSGIGKTQSQAKLTTKLSFGDDACFIARHKLADVIGVADGVGGWRTYGVDPSIFPNCLMDTCGRLVEEGRFQPNHLIDMLAASYQEILENKMPQIGSCTACVVALHCDENMIYTANLGDSGFVVIRRGEVIHRSEEQQHYFNTPFQLSVAPTVLEGMVLSDSPESAQSTTFGVKEGDLILVGTDGLFDNMSEEMLLYNVAQLQDHKQESLQKIANTIVQEAHKLAFDPEYMSPFSLNAAANGFNIKGGKPDDVTVLLSRVTRVELPT